MAYAVSAALSNCPTTAREGAPEREVAERGLVLQLEKGSMRLPMIDATVEVISDSSEPGLMLQP